MAVAPFHAKLPPHCSNLPSLTSRLHPLPHFWRPRETMHPSPTLKSTLKAHLKAFWGPGKTPRLPESLVRPKNVTSGFLCETKSNFLGRPPSPVPGVFVLLPPLRYATGWSLTELLGKPQVSFWKSPLCQHTVIWSCSLLELAVSHLHVARILKCTICQQGHSLACVCACMNMRAGSAHVCVLLRVFYFSFSNVKL